MAEQPNYTVNVAIPWHASAALVVKEIAFLGAMCFLAYACNGGFGR